MSILDTVFYLNGMKIEFEQYGNDNSKGRFFKCYIQAYGSLYTGEGQTMLHAFKIARRRRYS